MLMHQAKYPQLETTIGAIYDDFVLTKRVLPSMRSLQFGGRPIEMAHNRIFNCAYMPCEDYHFFSELMFLLAVLVWVTLYNNGTLVSYLL